MKKAKWRRRLRGTCKWGGVTLCVLLFALWLASGWWEIAAWSPLPGDSNVVIEVYGGGGVYVLIHTPAQENNFKVGWSRRHLGLMAWNYFDYRQHPTRLFFPFWLPFLLPALPTSWLFWSDHRRRTRVGHCAMCGYDLTGNTSGKCPECGATTPARAAP